MSNLIWKIFVMLVESITNSAVEDAQEGNWSLVPIAILINIISLIIVKYSLSDENNDDDNNSNMDICCDSSEKEAHISSKIGEVLPQLPKDFEDLNKEINELMKDKALKGDWLDIDFEKIKRLDENKLQELINEISEIIKNLC